ncbi:MAG: zinc-ribbon domain-containing protein [Gemmobacter sp.]
MLIVCPNCAARYEVAALALPAQGREVECTACGHVWLHLPPPDARRAAAAAPDPDSAPPPEIAPQTAPKTAPQTAPETALPGDEAAAAASEAEPDFALSPLEARLPPEVLALLREEAAREIAARRAEARGAEARGVEARGEEEVVAGADAAADAPPPEAPAEAPADVPPDTPPAAAPAAEPAREAAPTETPATGTRATAPAPDAAPPWVPPAPPAPVWPVASEPAPLWTPAPAPSEGPSGLALTGALGLLALSIAALIYVGAPALGRAVPSLGPILSVYVDAADWILAGLRGWILALPTRLSGG